MAYESHPALFRHASIGVPNRVVAVVRSVRLAPRAICLHAGCIHLKQDSGAMILKCVQKNGNIVVCLHVLTAGEVRSHLVGMAVMTQENEIERGPAVCHPHLGFLGSRFAIRGLLLDESCDVRQLAAQLGARGHSSEIVQLEWPVDDRNNCNGWRDRSRLGGGRTLFGLCAHETRSAEKQSQTECTESHDDRYVVPFLAVPDRQGRGPEALLYPHEESTGSR